MAAPDCQSMFWLIPSQSDGQASSARHPLAPLPSIWYLSYQAGLNERQAIGGS